MNFITQLKDRPNKNKVYPITLEKAVYDDDGNRLDTKVAQLRADVDELLYKDLTLSLVLEGAMNDTITIYDNANTQVAVCAFNNATMGIVTLTIPKDKVGTVYRFVSSVAKEKDNVSDFSKVAVINADTTKVRVMPDVCWYWYGNIVGYESAVNIVFNTNSLSINNGGIRIGDTNAVGTSKFYARCKGTRTAYPNTANLVLTLDSDHSTVYKTLFNEAFTYNEGIVTKEVDFASSSILNNASVYGYTPNGRMCDIYALWAE